VTFYHFFSKAPRARYNIYLNNSITACLRGRLEVKEAFERECGTKFGSVTQDGMFGLFDTSCIGMNDQGPAAIINDTVFTNLTPYRVRQLINDLKAGKSLEESIYEEYGDGNNSAHDMKVMVHNNIRKTSILLNRDYKKLEVVGG
jgi:[NiFe] hydrogenase diaphorase moiety large subunit